MLGGWVCGLGFNLGCGGGQAVGTLCVVGRNLAV